MAIMIEIYNNPETDLWDLRVHGDAADDWDALNDLTEQEALEEADSIAAETSGVIYRT